MILQTLTLIGIIVSHLFCYKDMSNFDKNKFFNNKMSYSDILRGRIKHFIEDVLVLSQRKFAKETGINYQKLNKSIKGETKVIDAEILFIIIKKKRLNPTWLFTGKGSKFLNEDDDDDLITQFKEQAGGDYIPIQQILEELIRDNQTRIITLENKMRNKEIIINENKRNIDELINFKNS